MKKNIFYSLMTLFVAVSFTGCSEDEGTEPGNDSKPVATVYTYSAEAPNDPDVDCVLRIATNSATKEVYYLAEKTTDYEDRLASGGESGVIEYVVGNGTSVSPDVDEPVDVVLKNLGGENTIAVVAVNGSTRTLATANFTGYAWIDVTTGTYTTQFSAAESLFGWTSTETTLQYKEDDPTQYRFKDLFGTGNHLTFSLTEYATEDGGTYCLVGSQSTPFSYGSYGTIYVNCVATWQNDINYVAYYPSVLYSDGTCLLYLHWYVSAGYLSYAQDYFVPAQ